MARFQAMKKCGRRYVSKFVENKQERIRTLAECDLAAHLKKEKKR